MIPELVQPQKYKDLQNEKFKTTFKVRVKYNITLPDGKTKKDVGSTQYVYIPFHKTGYSPVGMGDVFENNGEKSVYVNNVDEQCFVYDYYTLIKAINDAIQAAFENISQQQINQITYLINQKLDTIKRMYFELEGDRLRAKFNHYFATYKIIKDSRIPAVTINSVGVFFTYNLYKYIGNGFNCKFPSNEGWWFIARTTYNNDSTASDTSYYSALQSYSTLANWHCLKAIIIGSDSLPVVEEYLPVSRYDGFLTHYDTESYRNGLKKLGINYEEDNRDTFKKNTLRVLTVYYPFTSTPGDVRSTVIYSAENIIDGQYLELAQASPIQKINIWVKWMDTYGNLYDLRLYPGCAVDIRLCFSKDFG